MERDHPSSRFPNNIPLPPLHMATLDQLISALPADSGQKGVAAAAKKEQHVQRGRQWVPPQAFPAARKKSGTRSAS
jgi:hypothetical protein